MRSARHKLTDDDVIAIRSIWRGNEVSGDEIGLAFGVQQPAISKVVNRVHWRHLC